MKIKYTFPLFILLLIIFISPSLTNAAAVSIVQSAPGNNCFGCSSYNQAFSSGNTAGNTSVVAVQWVGSGRNITSVTDSQGNSYTLLPATLATTADVSTQIAYANNIKAGPNTVIVNWNASGYGFVSLFELSSSVLDKTSASTGTSGNPSAGTVTTTTDGEFALVAALKQSNGTAIFSSGSGWTLHQNFAGGSWSQSLEYQVQNTAGNLSGDFTTAGGAAWAASMATFVPSSSNPPPAPSPTPTPVPIPAPVPTPSPSPSPTPTPAAGSTFYVSLSGNDTNSGTEAQPWRTIQKAANTLTAGQTVIVKAGTYNERVATTKNGSPGALITFKANPGDTVILDGQGQAGNAFNTTPAGNYIRIEGFEIKNYFGTGILICNAGDCNIGGAQIVGNIIHDGVNGVNSIDSAGIYYSPANNALIENNTIYNMPGNGIAAYGGVNTIIRGNTIHHNGQDALKLGPDGYMLIENNKIYNQESWTAHGDGIQMSNYTVPGPLIIRNNIFGDNTQNIFLENFPKGGTWGDIYIYNNVVYNTHFQDFSNMGYGIGISAGVKSNSIYIYNNTCYYMVGNCIATPTTAGLVNTLMVKNNIVYNSMYIVPPAVAPNQDTDYNLFDINLPGRTWYMPGFKTLAGFQQSNPNFEQHSRTGNTKFVNPANLDFRVQSTSDAINNGTALPSVGGLNFALDTVGASRPQGSVWDIGAYQFGGSSPSPTLTPSPTPTPTAVPVAGDLNLDHTINALDYSLLNSKWNQNYSVYDLLLDGLINSFDYAVLKSNWGKVW